jgi:glucose-1-phosphate adenylyltransferase
MKKVLTIILAGGTGERLNPLTLVRSKPAVPFGGKYRLIDFTLSNCINSDIRRIYVLTQYRSLSLQRHIQEGWFMLSSRLGEFIYCVPAQQKVGTDWYRGTADAIRQNLDLIKGRIDFILILSADHVYKMNYLHFLHQHMLRECDLTISAIRVKKDQASRNLGVLEIDNDYRLVGFKEKPREPKTIPDDPRYSLASMGIYIFNLKILLDVLREGGNDFGREIIPKMIEKGYKIDVYDYSEKNQIEDYEVDMRYGQSHDILVSKTRDSSYWRDVGTIDSYYDANMDLIAPDPVFNVYGKTWPLRTYHRPISPSKCFGGGRICDSIVSEGCIISGGLVKNSILSPGVIVDRDAIVEDSILFDDVIVEPGTKIRKSIIDKESRIKANCSVGYDLQVDIQRGFLVSKNGVVVVPRSSEIGNI